jgi:hypothetical protein
MSRSRVTSSSSRSRGVSRRWSLFFLHADDDDQDEADGLPVDDVHVLGAEAGGELQRLARRDLLVLESVYDADWAGDGQAAWTALQLNLVGATVLGKVELEQRVPELVGDDVGVPGLQPRPHLRRQGRLVPAWEMVASTTA